MAPLAVPICTRAAIPLIGRVVPLRSRAAMASLPASLRRQVAQSDSCQPRRASSSVMKRGDQREAVFRDNEDRQSFLATLEPACRNTDWLAADPFLSRRAISNLEHLHLA